MARSENMDVLRAAYDALVKAGADSLTAAYTFGQVVDALSGVYSMRALGEAIGRSPATVYKYARLYRRYPTLHALHHMAAELGTYDVSLLNGDRAPAVPVRYVYHCVNCGSYDVAREKQQPEEPPAGKFTRGPEPAAMTDR